MPADSPDWPFFAPQHRALAQRLAAWEPARAAAGRDAAALLAELGAAGWLGHAIPQDGQRFDCRALFLLREALAAADARSDAAFVAQTSGAAPLVFAGSADQRARLAAARDGIWRLAAAGLGHEPAFRLTQEGESYRVSGAGFALFGAAAESFSLYAADEGSAVTALLVSRDTAGLSLAVSGDHADLTLSDCRVAAAARIGAAGEGARLSALTRELVGATAAAAALGLARLVLDRSAGMLANRAAFGRRLLQYQEMQGRLAAMATQIEAARLLAYRAAWARDRDGSRMPRETSMARLAAFEAVRAAIGEAQTILAEEAGWVAAMLGRWQAVARDYDKEIEELLLAGQSLTLLRPAVDGWHGRKRADA